MSRSIPPAIVLALGLMLPAARPLHAETFDTCSGFVEALPATITSQGTWCLRSDVSTAIASGAAITIASNNVTLDCNHFKIGGLAAGEQSLAIGVQVVDRSNVTVRHCHLRGFHTAVELSGGAGHLVADNVVERSLYTGIRLLSPGSMVQRNRVLDTGRQSAPRAHGIEAEANILDNEVSGLVARPDNGAILGIVVRGAGSLVRGNAVRMRGGSGTGIAALTAGIHVLATGVRIADNHLAGSDVAGYGINQDAGYCLGNSATGFASGGIASGCPGSGNVVTP